MRYFIVLVSCAFILVGCAKVETASNDNTQTNSNKIVSVSPTIETDTPLKPVTPKIKLDSKQKKYLNESLPPQVREILEKAQKFEILAEIGEQKISESDSRNFEPNRFAKIANDNNKQEVLEALYFDASSEDSPAICFEPHHGIRATYQDKTVEIEICFDCSRFVVNGSFGKFEGTIVRENRKSEDVLNRVIQSQSVEIK